MKLVPLHHQALGPGVSTQMWTCTTEGRQGQQQRRKILDVEKGNWGQPRNHGIPTCWFLHYFCLSNLIIIPFWDNSHSEWYKKRDSGKYIFQSYLDCLSTVQYHVLFVNVAFIFTQINHIYFQIRVKAKSFLHRKSVHLSSIPWKSTNILPKWGRIKSLIHIWKMLIPLLASQIPLWIFL